MVESDGKRCEYLQEIYEPGFFRDESEESEEMPPAKRLEMVLLAINRQIVF